MPSTSQTMSLALKAQKIEITEHLIFSELSKLAKNNQNILTKLSSDSQRHAHFWEKITLQKQSADKFQVWLYPTLAKIFGLTFVIKMLESSEQKIESYYELNAASDKKYSWIIDEEKNHEKLLVKLIDEDFLNYVSSIVLGSSDALVELTGTLAGLTLTLQDHRLIGVTGLITGIAASLSMAASEYLSTKSAITKKNPLKASIYTGITYVTCTFLLIFPYFILQNYLACLAFTLMNGTIIVLLSSFYLSVTQEMPFRRRFLEGVSLTYGVALISFLIGILVHQFLHLNI